MAQPAYRHEQNSAVKTYQWRMLAYHELDPSLAPIMHAHHRDGPQQQQTTKPHISYTHQHYLKACCV